MARITAWRPLQDLFSTRREIDRIFDSFFHNQSVARPTTEGNWSPPVDVVDAEDHVEFHAEVPGMSEDDVKVSVSENVLSITGEKKTESEDTKGRLPPFRAKLRSVSAFVYASRQPHDRGYCRFVQERGTFNLGSEGQEGRGKTDPD